MFTFDKDGKYVSVKDVMGPIGTKQGMIDRVEDFFKHKFRDVTSRETIEWGERDEDGRRQLLDPVQIPCQDSGTKKRRS